MQKITKEQFDNISHVTRKRQRNPVIKEILDLRVGEAMIIEKADWKIKSSPKTAWSMIRQKNGVEITTRTLQDDAGWAILRVK